MEIIEISSDDEKSKSEEVEIIETKSKANDDIEYVGQQSIVVCFGMFRAPVHLFQPIPTQIVFVKVNFDKKLGQEHYSITFSFDDEPSRLGEMVDEYARFLSPLAIARHVQFEAYLDSTNRQYPITKILLYGLPRSASIVAGHFVNHKVPLDHPDIQPKRPYVNPTLQPQNPNQPIAQTQILDQTKKQIEELYKSFTSPQNLQEMNQDRRLVSTLFKYQKQALHWMYHREQVSDSDLLFWKYDGFEYTNMLTEQKVQQRPKPTRGGILADDMGLGKTIQIISLMLKAQPEYDTMPMTIKQTSVDPFGFVPAAQVPKKLEDDPNVGKVPSRSTLIICPLSLIHNWEDQIVTHTERDALSVLVYHGPGRLEEPYEIAKYDVVITTYNVIGHRYGKSDECSALHRVYWHRIVLDEAHTIKSANTLQAKSVFAFKADVKWCLTGTPIQNKLDDLFSLVRFIEIQPLDRKADWCTFITRPIVQQKSSTAFRRLQTLMKGITLRRVKTDLIDGKPILQLPERTEHVMMLELDSKERETYDRIHQAGRQVFETLKARGHVLSQFAMILKAVLMMRQACLHPQLAKWDEKEFLADIAIPENTNTKLTADQVKSMFLLQRQTEEDTCVFCHSTVEGPGVCMAPCKHLICSHCRESNFPKPKNHSHKSSSPSPSPGPLHLECPLCRTGFTSETLAEVPEDIIENVDQLENSFFISNSIEYSTKVDALIKDLTYLRARDVSTGQVTKSVVFSQFTTLLTLMQEPLKKAGFKFVRLDGGMSRIQRSNALNEFKNNPEVSIFLLSIKAGGVGLNLVAASRVYLMEPYWNPAVEQQAIDRVHRLGQTKEVSTVRFIIKNSIEENMQKRQKYKMALAEKALNDDGGEEDQGNSSKRKRKRNPINKESFLTQKLESISILFQ